MKMKSVFSVLFALILTLGSLSITAAADETFDVGTLYKNKDVDDAWSLADAQVIDLNAVQSDVVTISRKGDYVLSGILNGQVVIEAPEKDKVRLILNGVTIVSDQGPAIYETQSDKLIVTLAEGSVNELTDGSTITDADDTIGAALYAEDDLSINGTGSLIVNGTQKHGIQSKADIVIANGNITVNAVTDGVRGRNSILVLDGKLNITAGGDGVTTTRTDAEGKGWIVFADGSVTIKTGDGAGTVRASANSQGGFGGRGRKDDWGSASSTSANSVSQKAVKAATNLTVLGGTFTFDCADDGLHGVNVTVNGGIFCIKSGDDGMHADQEMTVNAGSIDIAQCYEGIEGKNVTVNGGDIKIISSDDGINASGGSDGSGFGGWGRDNGYTASRDSGMLTITGGTIAVTAGGDGLDSNGSIAVTGGVTGVWTASSGMEGPIDFNGNGTITGGTLIVTTAGSSFGGRGSAGLSGLKTTSVSTSGQAGDTIAITDQTGTVIGSFTPENAFNTLIITASTSDLTVQINSRTIDNGAIADSGSSAITDSLDGSQDQGTDFGNGKGHGRRGH